MSKSTLNSTLQRPLLDGAKYNVLFSSSNCTLIDLGKGDTEYTVNEMKDWILETQSQLKTAKVKQLFSKPTQQATITTIKSFIYNHFQYTADGLDQNLRSPNCAWQQRHEGIDCKTYSILASVLLLKCNLIHYVRRITQPNFNPTQYTHVYVVVPYDQVNGDLSKGYYTIDGTLPTMQEPAYLEKHDTLMNKLPHYGLKGAAPTHPRVENIKTFISQLSKNGVEDSVILNIITIVNKHITNGNVNFQFQLQGNTLYVAGTPIQLNTKSGLNGWFDGIDFGGLTDVFSNGSGASTDTSTGGITTDTGSTSSIDWAALLNDNSGTIIDVATGLLNNGGSDGATVINSSGCGYNEVGITSDITNVKSMISHYFNTLIPAATTPEAIGVEFSKLYWFLVNMANYVPFQHRLSDACAKNNAQVFFNKMATVVLPDTLTKLNNYAANLGYTLSSTSIKKRAESANGCCRLPEWAGSNLMLDTQKITLQPTVANTNQQQINENNKPKTAGSNVLGWALLLVAGGLVVKEVTKSKNKPGKTQSK